MCLEVLEDNEATIKIVKKKGSAKLRHVSRTHKVNLASTYEAFEDPYVDIAYVNTKEQAADIFTKALSPQLWDNALRLLGMLAPAGVSDTAVAAGVASCAGLRPRGVPALPAPLARPSYTSRLTLPFPGVCTGTGGGS